MTHVEHSTDEDDLAIKLSKLPPSAWLRAGVSNPRNVWGKFAKKGGTSKTTSTLADADAIARFGLNVLVIDFDPQGNSSLGLDSRVELVSAGVGRLGSKEHLIPDRHTVVEVIDADESGVVDEGFQFVDWQYNPEETFQRGGPLIPGRIGTVGVVPCYEGLEGLAEGWAPGDIDRFAKALLEPASGQTVAPHTRWDVVLLDFPPGGGMIGRMGLRSAHWALIVTNAEPFGLKAVEDSVKFVNDVKGRWDNPSLTLAGLVFSTYKPRLTETKAQLADFNDAVARGDENYAVEQWKPTIPDRQLYTKSQSYRVPVSRLLTERRDREAAELVCQVSEAIVLKMLKTMNHPQAAELQELWNKAWPHPLHPHVTGDWKGRN